MRTFPKKKIALARRLRKSGSIIERRIWTRLKHAEDLKFRRQHPIGPYIVDFACPAAKLAVELDGVLHENQADYDKQRSNYLATRGYAVVRFWSTQVQESPAGVAEAICERARERIAQRMRKAVSRSE